jgi:hypothetical protein
MLFFKLTPGTIMTIPHRCILSSLLLINFLMVQVMAPFKLGKLFGCKSKARVSDSPLSGDVSPGEDQRAGDETPPEWQFTGFSSPTKNWKLSGFQPPGNWEYAFCQHREYKVRLYTFASEVGCQTACGWHAEYLKRGIALAMGMGTMCNPVGWICFSQHSFESGSSSNQSGRASGHGKNRHDEGFQVAKYCLSIEKDWPNFNTILQLPNLYTSDVVGDAVYDAGRQCTCYTGVKFGTHPIQANWGCDDDDFDEHLRGVVVAFGWELLIPAISTPGDPFKCGQPGLCTCGQSLDSKFDFAGCHPGNYP